MIKFGGRLIIYGLKNFPHPCDLTNFRIYIKNIYKGINQQAYKYRDHFFVLVYTINFADVLFQYALINFSIS